MTGAVLILGILFMVWALSSWVTVFEDAAIVRNQLVKPKPVRRRKVARMVPVKYTSVIKPSRPARRQQ